MIGAIAEVTQDPTKAGNALKTISMRIRGMKKELAEAGESAEGVGSITDMQGKILKLTRGKVNIFGSDNEFRSTYDILNDIARIYDDLTSKERADLLETMAGKNRANDLAAYLANYEHGIAMVEAANDSAGSAAEENAKYVESLQGKLNSLMSSFQVLSSNVLDSSFLKGLVDGGTDVLNIFNAIAGQVGTFPSLMGAAAAGLSLFGKGFITVDKSAKGFMDSMKLFGSSLSDIKNAFGIFMGGGGITSAFGSLRNEKVSPFADFMEQLERDKQALQNYKDLMSNGADSINQAQITEALAGSSDALKSYIEVNGAAGAEFEKFAEGQKKQQVSIQASNKSFKSVSGLIDQFNGKYEQLGMSTDDFTQAVGQSNTVLGSYLSSVKAGEAGLGGYIKKLAGAKAAQLAFSAAAAIGNAALTMGASLLVGAVVGGISKAIHYYDDLAESVNNASNEFEKNRKSLMDGRSDYNTAVETYDKLSKGVSKTGENISLTASEYEEYQNAANTIAASVPSMVAGFDAQGNAILNTTSNVETLTDAYNKLIVAQANAILDKNDETGYEGVEGIVKDYEHDLKEFKKKHGEYDIVDNNTLESLLNTSDIDNYIKRLENAGGGSLKTISDKLIASGFEKESNEETNGDFIARTIREDRSKVESIVKETASEYESLADDMKNAAKAFLDKELYGNEDVSGLQDSTKNILSQYVNSLDAQFFEGKTADELESYITGLTGKFAKLGTSGEKALQEAFDSQIDFDAGKISMEEFANKAKELDATFNEIGLGKKEKTEFMAKLGFEYNGDELKDFTKDYEDALARFGGDKASNEIKNWLSGLTGSELGIVMEMELDGDETISELQDALDLAKALNGFNQISIEVETQSIEALNAAIKESNSEMGMSQASIDAVKDRYSSLDGYDPAAVFEKTTTGVRANTEALAALEEQYVANKKAANQQNLDVLIDKYASLTKEIETAKAAGDTATVDSKTAERSTIADAIEEAKMLTAQYDGMTSAYKRWVDAQAGGEEGDMYDSILSGKEQMQEYAKKGLWGRNDLQAYADMMFAEGATSDWSAEDYAAHWGEVVAAQDRYFTESRQGVDNFLADMHEANADLIEMTDEGWKIKPNVDVEDIAKAMNKSTAFVEAMLKKANDYGSDFKIGIDQKSVDELVAESEAAAKAAQDSLKQYLGEDFEIDYSVNVNDDGTNDADAKLEKLKQQRDEINNSEATIDVKEQGFEAVDSAIKSVIAQKIALEQPAYMTLDASDVDSSMADALAKAQEMKTAINELNNLQLQYDAGIEVDPSQLDAAQQKVNDIAKTVADNKDLKMSLGFEDNADVNSIIAGFKDNKVTIPTKADTSGAKEDIATLQIDDKTVDVTVNIVNQDKIDGLKAKIDGIKDKTVKVTASADGDSQVSTLKTAIDGVKSKNVAVNTSTGGLPLVLMLQAAFNALTDKVVTATANVVGTDLVNALKSAIDSLVDKTVKVTASVAGTELVTELKNEINNTNSKTVNITTYKTTIKSEKSEANGTAHADGTAFAHGNWSTKNSGTALMGELGPEIIVRDGRFFTVGDDGAEFVPYKKGDIIFNHIQSAELLKNGYVTSGGGRGRAYVEGTAFANVSGGGRPIPGWGSSGGSNYNKVTNGSSKSTKSSKSSSSDSKATEEAEKFEEVLDWIEVAIDRIERAIKNLDTVASSTFRSWSERTSALNSQIAETRNEIDLQQRAYDRYMKAANGVGLDASWAQKVRDGKIDIELVTDENLKEKIDQYQQWYEKALDARDAIVELQEAEAELYKQRFDNVSDKFDGYLGVIQHEKDMLDEFISQSEASGYLTSKKYYESLAKNTKSNIAELKKQRDEMTAEMNAAVNSGAVEKYSQAWYEMVNAIDEVTLAIEQGNTELLEFKKTMRELDWEVFDLIQDRISNVSKEADFLIELMSNKKLYEDNGQLTDDGKATMGLHGQNYNSYMYQADKYAKEIKKLDAEIAKDPYNQDLVNRRQELLELQQEMILSAEDEKNAIRDMVEDGINKELDALQELIDKRNDALDSAKDLYDYQKKIAEQTKEIADLEKQLGAYAGDDSEEAKATIQELKVSLQEAKDNLEETEYDQYISDQKQLMDDLYLEYETILNARLDNIDQLMMDMIAEINADAGTIGQTIDNAASNVGYTLSESMKTVWDSSTASINGVITMYGDKFMNSQTTLKTALDNIGINVKTMVDYLNQKANNKTNQAGNSSASKPNNGNNSNNKPTTPTLPPQPAKPKADAYGIAGSIWVLGGSKSGWGNDPTRSSKLTKAYGADFARQVQSIINSTFATGRWDRKRDYGAYTSYKLLGYKDGKRKLGSDEYAWTQENGTEMIVRPSDGAILTPLAKGDSVLTSAASGNIWNMANNPADFIKSNLGVDVGDAPISGSSNNSYTQNIDKVIFNMPNVKNYDDLIRQISKDKNAQRLIQSMTIDQIAGGSKLAKYKAVK